MPFMTADRSYGCDVAPRRSFRVNGLVLSARLRAWRSTWTRRRAMAKSMAQAIGRGRLFEVAERLYDAMKARTTLPVNVDFFSAVVYDALGIPPAFCTSIFAVGRIAGWCAHALEQYADNRLIRPRAQYVGVGPRALPARDARAVSGRVGEGVQEASLGEALLPE